MSSCVMSDSVRMRLCCSRGNLETDDQGSGTQQQEAHDEYPPLGCCGDRFAGEEEFLHTEVARIGHIDDPIRPRPEAVRGAELTLSGAKPTPYCEEIAGPREFLHAVQVSVGYVEIAQRIGREASRKVEFTIADAGRTP